MKPKLKEGIKYDNHKTRFDLLSPDFLFEMADIMTFGAEKYSDRNYAKGMAWGRIFSALMRHSWNWFRGEENDKETGKSHLCHAACCLQMLYDIRHLKQWDDRPIKKDA